MAYSYSSRIQSLFLSILCFVFFFPSLSNAQLPSSSSRPHGVVLPVTKDSSTNQYVTNIRQRTPLVPVDLVVDLGAEFLWVDCDDKGYVSSSYRPPRCQSAPCKLTGSVTCGECNSPFRPGCSNNTCGAFPSNTVTNSATSGEFASDVVSVQSTDGSNPGQNVTVRRLLFGCGSTSLLDGLSKGVKGMVGLGRNLISLPSQFAAVFRFPRKFALCLSSGTGVILFGDGPYVMLPGINLSRSLSYTPLLINPVSTAAVSTEGTPSSEYFIGVKSIEIDSKKVPLNNKLLSINKATGVGGTKISTVNPYTVMETSIYNAFTNVFIEKAKAMDINRADPIAPFGVCFDMGSLISTRVGFGVPKIDLVLQNKKVTWSIFGANSMMQVGRGTLCLAFVDGGSEPRTSIVIGAHQLEDNLLQFDIPRSRLGFSSSLLFRQTTCSNFNFTTKG